MNRKVRALLAIVGVLLIAAGLWAFWTFWYPAGQTRDIVPPDADDAQEALGPLPENPIDFTALTAANDEIYAYIQIEGTKVDYPIVQSREDDQFYLRHRAQDRAYASSGAIYTQMLNHTDFSDPVTVIYGHNGYGDTMFTTLHYFEDKTFFEEHPRFIIWQSGRKLTYEIVSAFKYDDRHILNSFQLSDLAVLDQFQKMIADPVSTLRNVRQPTKPMTADSKLVILSTCITRQEENRYLVCGVLTDDQPTQ